MLNLYICYRTALISATDTQRLNFQQTAELLESFTSDKSNKELFFSKLLSGVFFECLIFNFDDTRNLLQKTSPLKKKFLIHYLL